MKKMISNEQYNLLTKIRLTRAFRKTSEEETQRLRDMTLSEDKENLILAETCVENLESKNSFNLMSEEDIAKEVNSLF